MPVRQCDGETGLQAIAVLTFPAEAKIGLLAGGLPEHWPALTPDCPAAHLFEREIAEH